MKVLFSTIFAFLFFFSSTAAAAESAFTVSYRGMVGLSGRFEHPLAERMVLFEEVGASGWLVYGDDPTGGEPSPMLLRLHGKLGVDVALQDPMASHWYVGGRVVGAYLLNTTGDSMEAAAQGTLGRKWNAGDWRLQLGAGVGIHNFWDLTDSTNTLFVPLPHVEARIGRRF